jgi:hypothetical protein
VAAPALSGLSDPELANLIRNLAVRIAVLAPQIEPRVHARKRTIKIVRSTALMAGGLLTATVVDLVGLIISLLGVWDCIEAVEDDVREMNREHAARRSLVQLEMELAAAEAEFDWRHRP